MPKSAPSLSRSGRLHERHPVHGLVVVPNPHCAGRIRRELQIRSLGLAEKSHPPIVVGTPSDVLKRMRAGSLVLSNLQVIVVDACSTDELMRPRAVGDLLKLVRPLPQACSSVLVVPVQKEGMTDEHVGLLATTLASRSGDDGPTTDPVSTCRVVYVAKGHSTRSVCAIFSCRRYYDSAKVSRR